MFTHVYLFTYVYSCDYHCSLVFTYVYSSLIVYHCLLVFNYVYNCLLNLVYLYVY